MAWRSDRGPWFSGARMRYVRVVSMGERRIAESAEEMQVSSKEEPGDDDVRISGSAREERPSSGKARIADRRLRIKVLRVGRSRE